MNFEKFERLSNRSKGTNSFAKRVDFDILRDAQLPRETESLRCPLSECPCHYGDFGGHGDNQCNRDSFHEGALEYRKQLEEEYTKKLEYEIQKLRSTTSTELEKVLRASNEELQREVTSLKEYKLHLERCREEDLRRIKDLSLQNQDLVIQMKKLQLLDTSKLAGIESELKLKKFELERCSLLLSENEIKYQKLAVEKHKLEEKYDILRDELTRVKIDSEEKICSLKLSLGDKESRLAVYEKLEDEIDNVVMQAASLPDEANPEQLLTNYCYGTNIPASTKRRMEHCLFLAKRVIELENLNMELKQTIFAERDEKQIYQEEINSARAAIQLCKYPTSDLLQLISKRDNELYKSNQRIKELQAKLLSSKEKESTLQKDLEQAISYRRQLQELQDFCFSMSKNGTQLAQPYTKTSSRKSSVRSVSKGSSKLNSQRTDKIPVRFMGDEEIKKPNMSSQNKQAALTLSKVSLRPSSNSHTSSIKYL